MKIPLPKIDELKNLSTKNEVLVAVVILAFCSVATFVDPMFFSVTTLTDLMRAAIVIGIMAVAVMMVLISGGIDVSFTAVAVFAMYSTTVFTLEVVPDLPWYFIFAISLIIGTFLGAINGFFVVFCRLPTLIVTLGTLSIFRGFLLTFIGSQRISALPPEMREFSRMMIARGTTEAGNFYAIPWAFAALVIVVILTFFILHKTMLGRSIFAIGGSIESARRIGVNVKGTQFFVYCYVGAIAGLAGIINGAMGRMADPFSLVGMELSVIAAVVLGGARLMGGYGTLSGTLLGVSLIVLVENSLIVVGIPSTWQFVTIGLLILIGTGLPAWRAKRQADRAS